MPKPAITFLGGAAYSEIGGIQTFNRNLLRGLQASGCLERGHLTNDRPTDLPAELQPVLSAGGKSRAKLLMWAARQRLRRADVLICDHLNYTPILRALPCQRLKLCALHAHEMEIEIAPARRRAMDAMDGFLCVSDYSKRLARGLGIEESKLHVCHHGLDLKVEPRAEPRTGRPAQLLFVGRLDRHYKGQEHLLEAAQALKLAGAQFHLNYAGGGKSLEAFRQRTAEMNLADCVTFHGFVSDEKLAELYQEADIFALPSSGEGFGLVYLEAMARGLPCIASTAGAAPEVVLDGECGRCIPYGDVTALTAALHELVQHPELRRRLGEAGRQRYLQHFTETAFTVRFQALLERLLAG